LSEEQGERIEIGNNRDFEQSSDIAEPGEIIREEVVEVAEKPNTETFPLSSKEEEDQKNEVKTDNGDIHEQVKAQSIQLSSLAEMVESLQSQVKQLQETIRLLKHKKTSSVRKRSTSSDGTKTKKKTKRRGSASRKK
jgi:predicted RNase H-like nuclease (RuvC/YqgF family)